METHFNYRIAYCTKQGGYIGQVYVGGLTPWHDVTGKWRTSIKVAQKLHNWIVYLIIIRF